MLKHLLDLIEAASPVILLLVVLAGGTITVWALCHPVEPKDLPPEDDPTWP